MGSLLQQSATTSPTVVDRSNSPRAGLRSEAMPSLASSLAIFALIGLWIVAVFATYARLPATELYNVSNSGALGGAARVLVFLGYPSALASILILGFVWARVRESVTVATRTRRLIGALTVTGILLCASVAVPGVLDPENLDAKPINAVAAAGVLLTLGLTAWAAWLTGVGSIARGVTGDGVRVALAIVLLMLSIPWLGAVLGFHIAGTPILGDLFLSGELRTQPGDLVPRSAVHLGNHEGLDGVLLVLIGLILSRELPRVVNFALRTALMTACSLAIVYGLAVTLKDFWLEQVVKRGWTDFEITGVLEPGVTFGWAGILIATAVISVVATSYTRRAETPS